MTNFMVVLIIMSIIIILGIIFLEWLFSHDQQKDDE